MTDTERYTGRVKWFNNKAGYGFITVTDGSKAGSDIFVHHSSIKIDTEQYKYLVQGEYVDFNLTAVTSSSHEYQAGDVSGIKGGKLMCETRNELRSTRSQHRESSPTTAAATMAATAVDTADAGGANEGTWVPAKKQRPATVDKRSPPSPVKIMSRTSGPAGGRGSGGRGPSAGGRGGRGGRGTTTKA
jgi:CspA family cold shock protein